MADDFPAASTQSQNIVVPVRRGLLGRIEEKLMGKRKLEASSAGIQQMVDQPDIERKKTFQAARDEYLTDAALVGDIGLTGFILQHYFSSSPRSLGAIGTLGDDEFLAFNALMSAHSNFVFINIDPTSNRRARLHALVERIEQDGYEPRAVIADLTIRGRWPSLLEALAKDQVGILVLDAEWTLSDPQFWTKLSAFIRSTGTVICVRGALTFENPSVSIAFLRSIPEDFDLAVVATTRKSLWLAQSEPASRLRAMLYDSGLFAIGSAVLEFALAERDIGHPVIIHSDFATTMVNSEGRFPRLLLAAGSGATPSFHCGSGWSTPEPDGRWTDGDEAVIAVTLPADVTSVSGLRIVGNPWISPAESDQVVEIGIGHNPNRWVALKCDDEQITVFDISVNSGEVQTGGLIIQLRLLKPGRPSDHGGSDSRMLGFKFRNLQVFV